MASKYIGGELHKALKITDISGVCCKCGKPSILFWKINKVIAYSLTDKEMARYCYDCSKNSWSKAFKLFTGKS